MASDVRNRCDSGRLRQLLDNELSAAAEIMLAEHLDQCMECCDRLEAMAAAPDQWQRFRGLAGAAEAPAMPAPQVARGQRAGAGDEEPRETSHPLLRYLGPTDEPNMLGRLGPYEVIGVIGEGGMGVVLKVFDRALNRTVAAKVLAPQLAAAAAARRRFAREAQAAAAVAHQHVIAIHAVAEFQGMPYLVMPYVPGGSLQQRIDAQGPLSATEILRIGFQTAAGLAASHAQGLVHRDIKPANILLEIGVERVLITDFGLARAIDDATLTCSGIIAGTPQYMAPEQAQGGPIDHRADLFSLGSVLYTMCTGRPPFRAPTAMAVMRRICEDRPHEIQLLNPDIPWWLIQVIDRLHAKDPADRFQSAAEVAELLEQCLAHVQNPAACPLPSTLADARRRPFLSRFRARPEGPSRGGRRPAPQRSLRSGLCGLLRWRRRSLAVLSVGLCLVMAGYGVSQSRLFPAAAWHAAVTSDRQAPAVAGEPIAASAAAGAAAQDAPPAAAEPADPPALRRRATARTPPPASGRAGRTVSVQRRLGRGGAAVLIHRHVWRHDQQDAR